MKAFCGLHMKLGMNRTVREQNEILLILVKAGIAYSVQLLATGWTTEGSEFESQ
jgi:hypothetical protein